MNDEYSHIHTLISSLFCCCRTIWLKSIYHNWGFPNMLLFCMHILNQTHTAILQTKISDERRKKVVLRTVLHSGAYVDPGLMSWLRLDNCPSVSYDSKMSQGLWRKPDQWVLYFFQDTQPPLWEKSTDSELWEKSTQRIADGGRDSGRSMLSPSAWAVWPDPPLSRWSWLEGKWGDGLEWRHAVSLEISHYTHCGRTLM